MYKYLLTIILVLSLFGISEARDTVDGYVLDSFEITEWAGMSAPPVSPANHGRIYYDSTADTLKLSLNAGPYYDLITTSSGGSLYYKLDGSNTTGIFYLDTNKYLKKIDDNTVGLYVKNSLVQDWAITISGFTAGDTMGVGCFTYSGT